MIAAWLTGRIFLVKVKPYLGPAANGRKENEGRLLDCSCVNLSGSYTCEKVNQAAEKSIDIICYV